MQKASCAAVVPGEEQAGGAVGGDAGGAAPQVDVARAFAEPGEALAGEGRPRENEDDGRGKEDPFFHGYAGEHTKIAIFRHFSKKGGANPIWV